MGSPKCALGPNCPFCRAGHENFFSPFSNRPVELLRTLFEKRAMPPRKVDATSVAAGIVHARAECTHDVTRDILSLCLRFIANEGLPRLEP